MMENEDRNTNEGMSKIYIIKLLQMKHLETMSLCHYVQGVVAGGKTKCPDK